MRLCWAFLIGMPLLVASAAPPQVKWVQSASDVTRAVVEVTGLPSSVGQDWSKVLAVYADQGNPVSDATLPPMLGSYSLDGGVLRFEPTFPLERGMTYRAVWKDGDEPVVAVLTIPKASATPTTTVTRIFPSAEVVPENLLKFYVQFSAPMSRGHIYEHIELKEQSGRAVELPFLEIDEELWDPEMKRLTLFIDPGRIKRGVRPLEEVGPALEAGKAFALIIRKDWHDAAGNPLKADFTKRFRVGPPDRDPPDPKRWKISVPKSKTLDALHVLFYEPMDWALSQRLISVSTEGGKSIRCQKNLNGDERELTLAPDRPWEAGRYKLVIKTTIEDLAGNNIGKPFEVDLFERVQQKLENRFVELAFEVK
jgi:hypothetical protein